MSDVTWLLETWKGTRHTTEQGKDNDMDPLLILFIAFGGLFALIGLIVFLLVADKRKDGHLSTRAAELIRGGASPQEARQQLVAEGVSPTTAKTRIKRAAVQAIVASTTELLDKGTPEKEIEEQLNASKLGNELGPEAVAKVIQFVAHPHWARQQPLLGLCLGIGVMVLSLPVLFAGLYIHEGNKTGKHTTFPFAGTLTLCVWAAINSYGLYLVSYPVYKFMKWEDPLKSNSYWNPSA
jgi:hypothetical protein